MDCRWIVEQLRESDRNSERAGAVLGGGPRPSQRASESVRASINLIGIIRLPPLVRDTPWPD